MTTHLEGNGRSPTMCLVRYAVLEWSEQRLASAEEMEGRSFLATGATPAVSWRSRSYFCARPGPCVGSHQPATSRAQRHATASSFRPDALA